ncbi:helix-turn-helix domain-containing protein [Cohnella yongneupensis]|uniref:Helix-turn-helix domain-containing protein n=1 Tax=Cohnella yongneupensis TaxID=425006 RepID=A0ABW0R084_9BACL
MKEYDLLRIQFLKTLLQMEEKLLTDSKSENAQTHPVKSSGQLISYPKDEAETRAVFSVSELSDYLGVSTDSIYTMVRENQIPFVRIRRRILFNRDSINSWILTNTQKT